MMDGADDGQPLPREQPTATPQLDEKGGKKGRGKQNPKGAAPAQPALEATPENKGTGVAAEQNKQAWIG